MIDFESNQHTVLVVEDQLINLQVLKPMLSGHGLRVLEARNGSAALALISQELPDLILLDIMLPDIDGYTVCRQLKTNPHTRDIPVLFISVLGDIRDKVKAFEAGGVDYVTKPFHVAEVWARVETHLKLNTMNKKLARQNQQLQQEIAQRERTEAALREAQSGYKLLFTSMLDGFALHEIVLDDNGKPVDYRFLDINPAFERLTGFTRDIIGKTVLEVMPQTEQHWIETYGQVALTGKPVRFENYSHHTDQKWFDVVAVSPAKHQFATFIHDITELKKSQATLEEHNQKLMQLNAEYARLNQAIEQAAESIIITDTDGAIIYVNPAFEQITGYSPADVYGQNPRILRSHEHPWEFYQEMWQTISAGYVWQGRLTNKKKSGALFTEDATISPVRDEHGNITHFVAVKRDITREIQLEERYHQAQKMESLGRLTGGVAHDFNNLLTAINGFAELIQMQLPSDAPQQAMLNSILHSGQRASDLVRQLLAFSRKQIIEPQSLNLNTVVSRMEKILRRIIGEDIFLETKLDPYLGSILFDPAQLEQVIINLAVNARDAMPDGGELCIKTANVCLDATDVEAMIDMSPGNHILLTIADNGIGIPADILDNIFEPFFTTKETGKGTGLGLATVYGIIKQNNGFVRVSSTVKQGTQFNIYLPQIVQPEHTADGFGAQQHMPTGTETVLVAEDDVGVRELSAHILQRLGYNLLLACNSREALEIATTHKNNIHLLLTDVVLPDIIGPKLAQQLKETHPALKVMFMSGYAEGAIARHGVVNEDIVLLQKPFSANDLARQVRSILDN